MLPAYRYMRKAILRGLIGRAVALMCAFVIALPSIAPAQTSTFSVPISVTLTASPTSAFINEFIVFTVRTSAPVEGLTINYGDGGGDEPVTVTTQKIGTAEGTARHAYTRGGTYTPYVNLIRPVARTTVSIRIPQPTLVATPSTTTIGNSVVFLFTAEGAGELQPIPFDFGDGTTGSLVPDPVIAGRPPTARTTHVYEKPSNADGFAGCIVPNQALAYIAVQNSLCARVIVMNPPATPAPVRPTPTAAPPQTPPPTAAPRETPPPTQAPTNAPSAPPVFRATPTPVPPAPTRTPVSLLHIVGAALSWPNGSSRVTVASGDLVPHPVAIVRVDRPGTMIFQWLVDGNPFKTVYVPFARPPALASDTPLQQKLELVDTLPAGAHRVSIVFLQPASNPLTGPELPAAIAYSTSERAPVVGFATPTPGPNATPTSKVGFYDGPIPTIDPKNFEETVVPHGVIDLASPKWGKRHESNGDLFLDADYGTPMLDDQTRFEWREENPGIADTFELRLIDRAGKIIVTRSLDGSQTYFLPDAKFFSSAFTSSRVHANSGAVQVAATANGRALGSASRYKFDPRLLQGIDRIDLKLIGALQGSDLSWEVHGFKTLLGKSVDVEKSPRWPLKRPDDAGGIASCNPETPFATDISTLNSDATGTRGGGTADTGGGSNPGARVGRVAIGGLARSSSVMSIVTGSSATRILARDPELFGGGKPPSATVDAVDYIYDHIGLVGTLNLQRSPYVAQFPTPHFVANAAKDSFAPPVAAFTFPNVYVDWGDGTIEPVTGAPPVGTLNQPGSALMRNLTFKLQDPSATPYIQHQYSRKNTYAIRVFQISDGDAQHVTPSQLGYAIDGGALAAQDAYFRFAGISTNPVSVAPTTSRGSARSSRMIAGPSSRFVGATLTIAPSPSEVTGRAYMLMCKTITIHEGLDNTAIGPLKLARVTLDDFGEHTIAAPSLGGRAIFAGAIDRIATRVGGFAGAAAAGGAEAGALRFGDGTVGKRLPPASGGEVRAQNSRVNPAIATPAPKHRPGPSELVYGRAGTCDQGLTSDGTLSFYGTGDAIVSWSLDGVILGKRTIPKLSSPSATGLGRGDTTVIAPTLLERRLGVREALMGDVPLAPDAPFDTTHLGPHAVRITVDVPPTTVISPYFGRNLLARLTSTSASVGRSSASSTSSSFADVSRSGMKFGVLSPFAGAVNGLPTVAYADANLASSLEGSSADTDAHRTSNPGSYDAVNAKAGSPCSFTFRTAEGDFKITDVNGKVTQTGTRYSGTGALLMSYLPDAGGVKVVPVPIAIHDWNVPDGDVVTSGEIDIGSPNALQHLPFAGASADIARVHASTDGTRNATKHLDLTIGFALRDGLLHPSGVGSVVTFAPIVAPLDTDGNWISGPVDLPATEIGNSGMTLQAAKAVFDYSAKDGTPAAGACDAATPAFVGIEIAPMTLRFNAFDLGNIDLPTTNWTIGGEGLCGKIPHQTVNFKRALQAGSIGFETLDVDVSHSNLSATLGKIDVHAPWLDADLIGDGTLVTSGSQELALTAPPVHRDYHNGVTMTVDKLSFSAQKGVGFTVLGDGHVDFIEGSVAFGHVDVPNIAFTFAGHPLFSNSTSMENIALTGATKFAKTPLDLESVDVTSPPGSGNQFAFVFHTGVRLSGALPKSETSVHFGATPDGTNLPAGTMDPFATEVVMPIGQPKAATDSHMVPKTDDGITYRGDVDLAMFDGPPVRAQFVLGRNGDTDYWVVRGDLSFPGAGTPLAPGVNLYKIGGGLGYHVKVTKAEDVAATASFDPSADLVFLAGLIVGSPDEAYTYWFDGQFKIVTGSFVARLDYEASILSHSHEIGGGSAGVASFDGYFQYGGGAFDGRLEGKIKPPGLEEVVYATIPGPHYGGGDYAAGMHFDSSSWDIYLGKKENPITAHIIVYDADSWFELGSVRGLDVGTKVSIDFSAGGSSVGAYIRGYLLTELQITPQPHLIGDVEGSLEIGACLAICFSVSASAQIHFEAVPIRASGKARVHISMPIVPDINVTVSASL